jgi:hypothetical protein
LKALLKKLTVKSTRSTRNLHYFYISIASNQSRSQANKRSFCLNDWSIFSLHSCPQILKIQTSGRLRSEDRCVPVVKASIRAQTAAHLSSIRSPLLDLSFLFLSVLLIYPFSLLRSFVSAARVMRIYGHNTLNYGIHWSQQYKITRGDYVTQNIIHFVEMELMISN